MSHYSQPQMASHQGAPAPVRRAPLQDATSRANTLSASKEVEKPVQFSPLAKEKNRNKYIPDNEYADDPIQPPSGQDPIVPIYHDANGSPCSARESLGIPPHKSHIGPWQLGQTVGKGGTCRVRLVRHHLTGEVMVAKIIRKDVAEKTRARSLANLFSRAETGSLALAGRYAMPLGLEREMVIMRLLKHPNIVRLYDVWENREDIYLIMERVQGGELFTYIDQKGKLPEKETVFLMRQLVEALIYCHRLQIHHRDIKPENILIDRTNLTVKLIDFGMAAFQPDGELLLTPCGSPHYAAPELLQGMPYDGSKADVWSVAVVCWVMLVGDPPFNYPLDMPEDKKLRHLYDRICAADVKIPNTLSEAAQDFFRRAFVTDPAKRMSIMQLWEHPLLHKFDRDFDYEGREVEHWIGPGPTLKGWKTLTPRTIDPQLLRSVLILWHDANEETVIERLCCEQVTQEKYFYSVLSKYRDEHLEAMDFSPARRRPGLVPSPSDYQHAVPNYPLPAPAHRQFPVRAPFNRTTFTPVPAVEVPTFDKQPYFNNIPTFKNVPASASTLPKPNERSASHFSVRKNEHLHSRHSFFGPPQSEASYDPFRASLGPSINVQKARASVRQHSSSPARYVKTSKAQGNNRFGSLRVEALKRNGSLRSSGMSSSSKSAKGPSVRPLSVSSERSKSLSRVSNSSSQWATSIGSPATITVRRIYHRHKRSVSFDHRRRGSTALANGSRNSLDTPSLVSSPPIPLSSGLPLYDIPSSPPIHPHNVLRSAKEGPSTLPVPRIHTTKHIEKEARKVSNELEKVCLEAFYRSSTSGSTRSSASGTNTPPTSASASHQQKKAKIDKELLNRPLPPPPPEESPTQTKETPRSYTVRELHEMRQRLAAKYAQDGANSQQFFHTVLQQLDSLMPPGLAVDGRRASSALTGPLYEASREELNHLQAIPEEGRSTEFDEVLPKSLGGKGGKQRCVTEPTTYRKPDSKGANTTIRVVEPSSPASPSPWAPLNIHKSSENATRSRSHGVKPYISDQRTVPRPARHSIQNDYSQAVADNIVKPTSKSKNSSKASWWRRASNKYDSPSKVTTDTTYHDFEGLDDRVSRRDQRMASTSPHVPTVVDPGPDNYPEPNEVNPFPNGPTVSRLRCGPQTRVPYSNAERYATECSRHCDEPEAFVSANPVSNLRSRFSPNTDSFVDNDIIVPVKKQFLGGIFSKKSKNPATADHDWSIGVDDFAEQSDDDVAFMTTAPADPLVHWNFFARLFNIRPESKAIVLKLHRREARHFVMRKLRDAKGHGLQDIKKDPLNHNYYTCRLGKGNLWGIKPVSVAIEFFKIDRDKKPSKLTTVRFTQTGGAATSLRALIDELFDIFYMTGAVLEHVEEANKIIAMIQTGKTTTT